MARLGATALGLERAEAKARRQAEQEENLQLALWRMDSALAPLMAEESARPYFTYSPVYPAERAFTRMFAEIERGDVLMTSPLLTFTSPQIHLHFQYGPDGRLSSPQVPTGNMLDHAETGYLSPELLDKASRRLAELKKLFDRKQLAAALLDEDPASLANNTFMLANQQLPPAKQQLPQSRSSNEFMMRSRNSKVAQNAPPAEPQLLRARTTVTQGPLQAVWIGRALHPGSTRTRCRGHLPSGMLARLGGDSSGLDRTCRRFAPGGTAGAGACTETTITHADAGLAAGSARARKCAG